MAINLNGTGSISGLSSISAPAISGVPTGSASAPAFSFTGDSNTGLYSPGADQVALSTNGTGRLFVDASGNVGAGTATPAHKLSVEGTTYANSSVSLTRFTTSASSSQEVIFRKSNSDTQGTNAAVGTGTKLGGILFSGANGTTYQAGFGIASITTSDWGTGTYSSALTFTDNASASERLRITSAGLVGIGTSSPSALLHLNATSAALLIARSSAAGTPSATGLQLSIDGTTYGKIYANPSGGITFAGPSNDHATIDLSGRLLVGTSSYSGAGTGIEVQGTGSFGPQIINSAKGSDIYPPFFVFQKARGTSIVQNNDFLGDIQYKGYDGSIYIAAATIRCDVDGTPGANDMPGRLVFSVTRDGSASPTEALRISNNGQSTYSSDQNVNHFILDNTNASYSAALVTLDSSRAASTAYFFLLAYSGNSADLEFNLRGDGNAFADGSWSGGGADYAEYFEWSDSNPDAEDRRGISVVLDGDKIREAQPGEDPIGVISGNPSVVGDAAWNKWSGKYLRDEFGTYIQENYEVTDDDGNTVIQQRRKLNPAYDPDVEYISREQRPEWDCVGLMGKLRLRKGQATGSRWIKMRDISDSVEEWLVR